MRCWRGRSGVPALAAMNRKKSSALAALSRAKLRILRRTLWENGFTLFILGPLIVGGFWFILEPTLARAAGWTQAAAAGMGPAELLAAGLALTVLLTAAGLPSALREVFAIRTPDSTLDALPVDPKLRFGLIALTQTARNLPGFAATWVGIALLAEAADGSTPDAAQWLAVMAAVALLQILGGLILLRWGLFRTGRLLGLAAVLLALAWFVRDWPAAVWASGPLAIPAGFFAGQLGAALHGGGASSAVPVAALALALLFAGGWAYGRWREEDRERAEAALAQRRRLLSGLERRLTKPMGREVAALLARDLRLTLRGFVPATAVAIAMAALCLTGGFVGGMRVGEAWKAPAAQLGAALACLSLSALAPLMLARQLPMHWLELSSGAAPSALWKAKSRLALIVSSPALVIALALGPALQLEGWLYFAFAARVALGWITMATIIGLLSFEIAPSPALGLLLGGLFAVGVCGFYAIPDYWPLGVFLYAYVMNALKERANQTAARLGAQV